MKQTPGSGRRRLFAARSRSTTRRGKSRRGDRNPPSRGRVAASLPAGREDVAVTIEFPATVNFGLAFTLPGELLLSLEADWTEWSVFDSLFIDFQNGALPDLFRETLWEDSWAYRGGLEKRFGNYAIRAGYYFRPRARSRSPMSARSSPTAEPRRLHDRVRYETERWGVDISDIFIDFDERDTRAREHRPVLRDVRGIRQFLVRGISPALSCDARSRNPFTEKAMRELFRTAASGGGASSLSRRAVYSPDDFSQYVALGDSCDRRGRGNCLVERHQRGPIRSSSPTEIGITDFQQPLLSEAPAVAGGTGVCSGRS